MLSHRYLHTHDYTTKNNNIQLVGNEWYYLGRMQIPRIFSL